MWMDLFNKSSESGLLKEIYSDIAQPGVKKVGIALETVLDFGNTLLIPIKLMNEKSKINFVNHMNRYKEKIENIESNKLATVPPEIGVPILEKLTYTTSDVVAELFLNLLTKASSIDTSAPAHPRFIDIVSNVSVDEAKIIEYLTINNLYSIPFIIFKASQVNDHSLFSHSKLDRTGLEKILTFLYPNNVNLYIDNLVSLGILRRREGFMPIESNNKMSLELLEHLYEDDKMVLLNHIRKKSDVDYYPPETVPGHYEVTRIGKSFISTCYSTKQ